MNVITQEHTTEYINKIYILLNKQRSKYPYISDANFEDLVQDSIITFLEKANDDKNIEAFACTILKHKYIDYYRKYRDIHYKPYDNYNLIAENGFDNKEEIKILRKSILKLEKYHERASLLLRYRGLDYKEIADSLDINMNTLKSHVRKGKKNVNNNIRNYK